MDDLITRLEMAVDGNRKLDSDIQEVLTGKGFSENDDWQAPWPHYTSSVDAALMLVPEGWEASIVVEVDRRSSVRVWKRLGETTRTPIYEAPTPALAVCIAALKARNGS